jgi:hypothetical protein
MCCSFVIPFFVFGLKVFFNSPTQFLPMKAGIEWCAALLWFLSLCLVLEYFNSPTIPTYKAGLSDVLLFCDSFLCVWSWSIFQQSYPILPMKAGWCAALLWFLSLCLVLGIFNSPTQFLPMKAGIECDVLWFLSLCFGLKVFFNSPTQFHLWKQGLSDVLLFCDSFLCVWS